MYNKKKTSILRRQIYIFTLLLFVLYTVNIAFLDVNAANKSIKAKKAYKNILANKYGSNNTKFTVVEISGDKIPELIVSDISYEPEGYLIYTYKGGKAKLLKKMDYFDGGEIKYIYPSKHIIETQEGDSWNAHTIYYKVTAKKIKKIKKKNLSSSKKYSLNYGKYKMKKNTVANRKKI